ncbi:MAG: hypothetical protein KGM94_16700, partial [Bradyrhizobium sp.]
MIEIKSTDLPKTELVRRASATGINLSGTFTRPFHAAFRGELRTVPGGTSVARGGLQRGDDVFAGDDSDQALRAVE